MRKTLQNVNIQNFEKVLLSLGYQKCRSNQYRKGKFHIIVSAKEKSARIEFHIHVDRRYYGPPLFVHHGRKVGKDIDQEYRNICRHLKAKA